MEVDICRFSRVLLFDLMFRQLIILGHCKPTRLELHGSWLQLTHVGAASEKLTDSWATCG